MSKLEILIRMGLQRYCAEQNLDFVMFMYLLEDMSFIDSVHDGALDIRADAETKCKLGGGMYDYIYDSVIQVMQERFNVTSKKTV